MGVAIHASTVLLSSATLESYLEAILKSIYEVLVNKMFYCAIRNKIMAFNI